MPQSRSASPRSFDSLAQTQRLGLEAGAQQFLAQLCNSYMLTSWQLDYRGVFVAYFCRQLLRCTAHEEGTSLRSCRICLAASPHRTMHYYFFHIDEAKLSQLIELLSMSSK